MSGTLSGRVALVTGSTDGIGLAIARQLASQGADVALNGFGEPAALSALCDELRRCGGARVEHFDADLLQADAAAALVGRVSERLGPVDILVNNAGTQRQAPIEQQTPEAWATVMALNLNAPFHTIRTALPAMRARGWGRIINIASAYGLVGGVDRSSYVASKHGLVGLSKAVALETAGTAITCNAICPGDVATRIFYKTAKLMAERDAISREEAQHRVASRHMPSARPVQPEQVAALALYLCSDAAAEIRGAALSVDGGWTAR